MGYMRHHAIVVTGSNDKDIEKARRMAVKLFDTRMVSTVGKVTVNGIRSFLVAPDGSKEGWDESTSGDDAREEFIYWLKVKHSYPPDEGVRECRVDWCEVQFGDDEGESMMLDSNDGVKR